METKHKILLGVLALLVIVGAAILLTPANKKVFSSEDSIINLDRSFAQQGDPFSITKFTGTNESDPTHYTTYNFTLPVSQVDGNLEYINDSRAYIGISPRVSNGKEPIYINLTSKQASGNLTFAMGLAAEDSHIKPYKIERYAPHNVTESFTCPIESEVWYNSTHFTCELYDEEFDEYYNYTHYYEWGNLPTRTAYWNITKNWKEVRNLDFNKAEYSKIPGADVWYYSENNYIVEDNDYFVRIFVRDTRSIFEETPKQVKYHWAFFPSNYGTNIQDALIDEKFYYIDPSINLTESLISYWDLDEESGTIAEDIHGTNNGTHVGSTLNQTGKIGKSVKYTDNTDYTHFGSFSDLWDETNNKATFSTWYKYDSSPGGIILAKYTNDGSQDRQFYLRTLATGKVRVWIGDDGGANNYDYWTTDNSHVNDSETWYHLAATIDLSTNDCTIYVDGSEVASTKVSSGSNVATFKTSAETFKIGRLENSDGSFAGLSNEYVDEVGIWDKALSADEIQTMYEIYEFGDGYPLNPFPREHTSVSLTSSSTTNTTDENLTVTFFGSEDPNNDSIYNITDWRVNGTSWALLNMPMDINSSTTTSDYSTYGNDGTVTGATWSSDCMVGGCYDFDGNTNQLTVTDADEFSFTDGAGTDEAFSISAWIEPDVVNSNRGIVAKTQSTLEYFFIVRGSSSKLLTRLYSGGSGSNAIQRESGTVLSTDTWYHVVVTYDGSESQTGIHIYVNGELDDGTAALTGSYSGMSAGAGDLEIGDWGTNSFNGKLDEVLILDRALSSEQIALMYQEGLANHSIETIVSQETNLGENWSVEVTPTDLDGNGASTLTGNLTIIVPSAGDTCTYSSGNWNVDCSDNCLIDSNVDLGGNDISITGTGTFTMTANITNYGDIVLAGTDSSNRCEVLCTSGGCFKDA